LKNFKMFKKLRWEKWLFGWISFEINWKRDKRAQVLVSNSKDITCSLSTNGLLMTNMTLPVPATCETHAIIQFNSLQTCASIYPMRERHYIMYYVVMHIISAQAVLTYVTRIYETNRISKNSENCFLLTYMILWNFKTCLKRIFSSQFCIFV